ncbi:hypothetical protein C8F04DRAFT_1185705 [Mycena alexandri]|uniref:Uncharacterized protein n=1 Tax=Mycena alexandri TaxID=1745969 RepID=A0AAD6SPY8_9AGAR|nr:hypothetical protein C8F04DRAFT_1185705 [Mycena alexandri]
MTRAPCRDQVGPQAAPDDREVPTYQVGPRVAPDEVSEARTESDHKLLLTRFLSRSRTKPDHKLLLTSQFKSEVAGAVDNEIWGATGPLRRRLRRLRGQTDMERASAQRLWIEAEINNALHPPCWALIFEPIQSERVTLVADSTLELCRNFYRLQPIQIARGAHGILSYLVFRRGGSGRTRTSELVSPRVSFSAHSYGSQISLTHHRPVPDPQDLLDLLAIARSTEIMHIAKISED